MSISEVAYGLATLSESYHDLASMFEEHLLKVGVPKHDIDRCYEPILWWREVGRDEILDLFDLLGCDVKTVTDLLNLAELYRV